MCFILKDWKKKKLVKNHCMLYIEQKKLTWSTIYAWLKFLTVILTCIRQHYQHSTQSTSTSKHCLCSWNTALTGPDALLPIIMQIYCNENTIWCCALFVCNDLFSFPPMLAPFVELDGAMWQDQFVVFLSFDFHSH